MSQDEYNEAWSEGYKDGVREILSQLSKRTEPKYKTTLTEAGYEQALSLLQVAEKEVAEYVRDTGESRMLSVSQTLIEVLTMLGVEMLEVK